MFIYKQLYSRKDVYEILNVPEEKQGGHWDTGYAKYLGKYYIFAGIETAGRTGHNYHNHWEGNLLYWRGKNKSHINQKMIKELLDKKSEVHIFTRTDSNNRYFEYQGIGIAESYDDTIPVTIYWRFNKENDNYSYKDEVKVNIKPENILEEAYRFFLIQDNSVKTSDDYNSDEDFNESEEDNNTDKTIVDWTEADAKNKIRKKRHEIVVQNFSTLLKEKGFEIWKGNIDCLGYKKIYPIIIGEVKTINGTLKDERMQVTKAFAQLYYYEMFAMDKFIGFDNQKVAVFERKISDHHINFLEKNSIRVIWLDDKGDFKCTDNSKLFLRSIGVE